MQIEAESQRVATSALESDTKPRLLFIRSTGSDCASFIRTHLHEHVKCLSLMFDVVLVDTEACDYKQLCETHKPALALFESGVYVSTAKGRNIRNTEAFPEIPKLGLCNADAYCTTREVFLADMYRWNIDTFFSISLSMGDYTPEISDRLFTWPNFADDDLYKDYGERKNIPILFTGSLATHYPWRNHIYNRVKSLYPAMLCPHFGWGGEREINRTIFGEQYARLLNASRIVPSCGTIANDLVRKHLEIPASRACLLAQRSAALEAAGFVHMKNCVFAEPDDVVDTLDYLFAHPDDLETITEEGYRLVHSRHLLKHRDQLYQWFTLNRRLGVDDKIVQPGPFQQLVVVPKDSAIGNSHICPSGIDRELLRMGDEKLECGKYSEAKELFIRCLNYHRMAEPCLRLVITNLFQGDAAAAYGWSSKQIELILGRHCASAPDPVEWAYAILVELCRGRELKALQYASMFPTLRHPELDRARFVAAIAARREREALTCRPGSRVSYSVHQLPQTDFRIWVRKLCTMLIACGQGEISERIASAADAASVSPIGAGPSLRDGAPAARKVKALSHTPVARIGRGLLRHHSDRGHIRPLAKRVLHTAERAVGCFLPYQLSSVRSETFYQELEKLCAGDNMTAILIVGAKAGSYVTGACMRGAQVNPNRPTVVCVSGTADRVRLLQNRYSTDRYVRVLRAGTDEAIGAQKTATLVVIDGSGMSGDTCRYSDTGRPSIIVLHDINTSYAYNTHHVLMACEDYELLDHSPHRCGYSIFKLIGDSCSPYEARREANGEEREYQSRL